MFSISQASRAISAWKKARWDLEDTKAPTPMATAPAMAAAMPPRAMVRTSPRVAVTPARKPTVEVTPSFSPKMISRTRRPWGVCQASSWKRLSGAASQVTGGGEAGRSSGVDAMGFALRDAALIGSKSWRVKDFPRANQNFMLTSGRREDTLRRTFSDGNPAGWGYGGRWPFTP